MTNLYLTKSCYYFLNFVFFFNYFNNVTYRCRASLLSTLYNLYTWAYIFAYIKINNLNSLIDFYK